MKRKCGTKNHLAERQRLNNMVAEIESKANYSLAVLGMAFVRNGSGKFMDIRPCDVPR